MSTDARKDRLVGTVLDGRFRLDRLLGAGGMGKVYAGHQLSVERAVAVKVLREELSESESLAQRFFREAKVVASLRHGNIVGLVDFGRDPERGLLYIAMEYIDGMSLADLLRRGRVEPALAVAITRQICSALAEAHSKGVIHRDLKPDNVMLVTTAEDRLAVKVLDFGIALPTGEEARLTNTGAVVGTPHYMAPEQAQDQPITSRSDLYSLGVLLYEMLSGRLPFVADTPMAVLLKVITNPTPALEDTLSPDQMPPEALRQLMEQLLEKQPSSRPDDVAQVSRALDDIARSEQFVTPHIPSLATLEALVIARNSDEMVFAATAASPVPTPSNTAAVGPVARPITTAPLGAAKPPVEVPERRRFRPPWWTIILLFPCCFCFVVTRADKPDVRKSIAVAAEHASAAHDVAVESLTASVTADAVDTGTDVGVARSDGGTQPVDTADAVDAPDPPPTTARPAKQRPRSPDVAPPAPAAPTRPPVGLPRGKGGLCNSGQCTYKGGPVACGGIATCSSPCPDGNCSQTCTDSATCAFTCEGGGCIQGCFGPTTCELDCGGGGCKQTCGLDATCKLRCPGGDCTQDCKDGDCTVKSCVGEGCTG